MEKKVVNRTATAQGADQTVLPMIRHKSVTTLQKQSEILCRCEDVKDVDSIVKSAKIPAILIYFALVSHLSGRLGIKNGNPA